MSSADSQAELKKLLKIWALQTFTVYFGCMKVSLKSAKVKIKVIYNRVHPPNINHDHMTD